MYRSHLPDEKGCVKSVCVQRPINSFGHMEMGPRLKFHPTDWTVTGDLRPQVYKSSDLSTTPWLLLQERTTEHCRSRSNFYEKQSDQDLDCLPYGQAPFFLKNSLDENMQLSEKGLQF